MEGGRLSKVHRDDQGSCRWQVMLGVGGSGGGQEGGQRSRRIVSRTLKGDIASQE